MNKKRLKGRDASKSSLYCGTQQSRQLSCLGLPGGQRGPIALEALIDSSNFLRNNLRPQRRQGSTAKQGFKQNGQDKAPRNQEGQRFYATEVSGGTTGAKRKPTPTPTEQPKSLKAQNSNKENLDHVNDQANQQPRQQNQKPVVARQARRYCKESLLRPLARALSSASALAMPLRSQRSQKSQISRHSQMSRKSTNVLRYLKSDRSSRTQSRMIREQFTSCRILKTQKSFKSFKSSSRKKKRGQRSFAQNLYDKYNMTRHFDCSSLQNEAAKLVSENKEISKNRKKSSLMKEQAKEARSKASGNYVLANIKSSNYFVDRIMRGDVAERSKHGQYGQKMINGRQSICQIKREGAVSNEARKTRISQNQGRALGLRIGDLARIKDTKTKSHTKLKAADQGRQKKQIGSLDSSLQGNQINFEHKLSKNTTRLKNAQRFVRPGSSSLSGATPAAGTGPSQGIKQKLALPARRTGQNKVLKRMRRNLSRKQSHPPEGTLTNKNSVNLQYNNHLKRHHEPNNDDLMLHTAITVADDSSRQPSVPPENEANSKGLPSRLGDDIGKAEADEPNIQKMGNPGEKNDAILCQPLAIPDDQERQAPQFPCRLEVHKNRDQRLTMQENRRTTCAHQKHLARYDCQLNQTGASVECKQKGDPSHDYTEYAEFPEDYENFESEMLDELTSSSQSIPSQPVRGQRGFTMVAQALNIVGVYPTNDDNELAGPMPFSSPDQIEKQTPPEQMRSRNVQCILRQNYCGSAASGQNESILWQKSSSGGRPSSFFLGCGSMNAKNQCCVPNNCSKSSQFCHYNQPEWNNRQPPDSVDSFQAAQNKNCLSLGLAAVQTNSQHNSNRFTQQCQNRPITFHSKEMPNQVGYFKANKDFQPRSNFATDVPTKISQREIKAQFSQNVRPKQKGLSRAPQAIIKSPERDDRVITSDVGAQAADSGRETEMSTKSNCQISQDTSRQIQQYRISKDGEKHIRAGNLRKYLNKNCNSSKFCSHGLENTLARDCSQSFESKNFYETASCFESKYVLNNLDQRMESNKNAGVGDGNEIMIDELDQREADNIVEHCPIVQKANQDHILGGKRHNGDQLIAASQVIPGQRSVYNLESQDLQKADKVRDSLAIRTAVHQDIRALPDNLADNAEIPCADCNKKGIPLQQNYFSNSLQSNPAGPKPLNLQAIQLPQSRSSDPGSQSKTTTHFHHPPNQYTPYSQIDNFSQIYQESPLKKSIRQIQENNKNTTNIFDKLVENYHQFPQFFDRNLILRSFFQLQTNEVQAHSQGGLGSSQGQGSFIREGQSPFINIEKVFQKIEESQAKQFVTQQKDQVIQEAEEPNQRGEGRDDGSKTKTQKMPEKMSGEFEDQNSKKQFEVSLLKDSSPVNPFRQPGSPSKQSDDQEGDHNQEFEEHVSQVQQWQKETVLTQEKAVEHDLDQHKEKQKLSQNNEEAVQIKESHQQDHNNYPVTSSHQEQQSQRQHQMEIQRRNLNQEHYQQTLNTVLNLDLLKPYQNEYKNLPQIDVPAEPVADPRRAEGQRQRRLLVIDIDETMIHTIDERDPPSMTGKFKIQIGGPDESLQQIELNIRPHLIECLQQLREKFQIIAFTASEQTYADAILDFLDPKKEIFKMRLYRQHCVPTPFGHIKDLHILKNHDLKDVLIIDNSCLSFAFNINNGVPILPFYDSDQDEELKHLTYYLNCLEESDIQDVRAHNNEAFGLLKLRDAFEQNLKKQGELDPIVEESAVGPHQNQKYQYLRSSGNQNKSGSSINQHHMASREYLQCDPVDFDHIQADVKPFSLVQTSDSNRGASPPHLDLAAANSVPECLLGPGYSFRSSNHQAIEVIEERVSSEEDCTSFKKGHRAHESVLLAQNFKVQKGSVTGINSHFDSIPPH